MRPQQSSPIHLWTHSSSRGPRVVFPRDGKRKFGQCARYQTHKESAHREFPFRQLRGTRSACRPLQSRTKTVRRENSFGDVSSALGFRRAFAKRVPWRSASANCSFERGNLRKPGGLRSLPLAIPFAGESRKSCLCGLILSESDLDRKGKKHRRLHSRGKTNRKLGAEISRSGQEPWPT